MIAAIVVPFGCRSIPRTASCFDEAFAELAGACLGAAVLDAAVDRVAVCFLVEDRAARGGLVPRFADLDFGLLVAIWLSLMSATASCAATDTSPAIRRSVRERRAA